MSNESFNRLINQYSSEAELEREAEARLQARNKRRHTVRQALLGGLVLCLVAYVGVNHAELQAQVVALFPAQESEYQKIRSVSDELQTGNTATADPASRPARVKQALVNAQQRTAIADSIIDNTPPPKTYTEPTKKP